MDVNRAQWQDYYILRPGESPRALYTVFDFENGHLGISHVGGPGFRCSLGLNGRSNIGMSCTQFTCVNSIANISSQIGNDWFKVDGVVYQLRTSCYSNIGQVVAEMKSLCHDVNFTFDHLGYCTYTGKRTLFMPLEHNGSFLEDSLAHKFGFQYHYDPGGYDAVDGEQYYYINPGNSAKKLGDLFGPLSDVLLTCDQLCTSVDNQVLAVIPLMSYQTRCGMSASTSATFKPLSDQCIYHDFTFRIKDRLGRPVHFLTNRPSCEVQLMHL